MSQLIIANWKSHLSQAQALAWLDEWAKKWQPAAEQTVVVAPPFSLVGALDWYAAHQSHFSAEQQAAFKLAVQDLSPFPAGAYTGAISIENLQGFAVKYALVGHSERRRYFHETNQEVANKVEQALAAGITPVVCVDRDYLTSQAATLSSKEWAKCVIAYEPLEAIGTGSRQPAAEVEPVVAEIKAQFGKVPVVYGGSVDADSAAEYAGVVDGLLVGGQSLKPDSFNGIVKNFRK